MGYSPWGRKESDTTEQLRFHFFFFIDFIICLCRLLVLLINSNLISITLKKQNIRSNMVELTQKILLQQLPGRKKIWRKQK